MELSGRWVATPADDDIRRRGLGLDVDDGDGSRWSPIEVPGHWQHSPGFEESTGPIIYRHRFSSPEIADGRRRFVTFDGIFYQADVWLDGAYLGDPEGYFFPHSFDITALAQIGRDHVLAVEVACAEQDPHARTNITGVLQAWEGLPTGWNPGGLWRSVRMYDTGPARLDRLRVICRDADERRAHLRLTAKLDVDTHREVVGRTLRDGEPVDEQSHPVASGMNDIEWSIDIPSPDLWWPRELGDQPMTTITVVVLVDGEASDQRERRTGLRQVDWHDWVCSVNGERLFLRGVDMTPSTVGIGDTDLDVVDRDLAHVVDLGLNTVRVHGHVSRRRFYDRADELGLLVLQDFPLERTHARSVRSRAVAQVEACVDSLGHHPSIVAWSGHNEPADTGTTPVRRREGDRQWRRRLRDLRSQQLPSWNKSVLDRWVKRTFERCDPSRLVTAHSGVAPHLPQLDGTDSHLWYGWEYGEASDLAERARRFPRSVRFVSEFGASSVPDDASFLDERSSAGSATTSLRRESEPSGVWPDLDWDRIGESYGLRFDVLREMFPPDDHRDIDAWRAITQSYQSYVLKVQIETLRRLKYRPTGGFCFSSLADARPVISPSILDHRRVPKDAYAAVRASCAPVIVVADLPPDWINPGDRLRLDVHLVNDLRAAIEDAVVDIVVRWAGGEERSRFGGPVAPDDVVKVGRVDVIVPDTLGELAIELTATDAQTGDLLATNRYTTAVTLPPD
ncbi:MAG: sugar-binding domain-containing protein [Actinomycetota bacterium]